ncbi:GILT-like protein 1 [Frankliniella occidentalis]|uniref:GILT-like protein 1 n=1 Tax=Frankliniella occidentalis TaxID=133901 RepID=A0A6J1TM63_FRAOC|nr:GILT-like protein 1 [Frankliniella occidentalis]
MYTLLVTALLAVSGVSGIVPVTVYYESLCPDSMKFFVNQLYPAMMTESLLAHTDLTLIPYGFAQTNVSSDGSYSFTCQHGDRECYGNKVHACALQTMTEKGQLLRYLTCLFQTLYRDRTALYPSEKCADLTGVDPAVKQSIVQCANSTKGDQLLADMGKLTPSRPELSWVPTVVLNNTKNQQDIDEAQTNLKGTICQYISDPKPSVCGGPRVTVYYETLCPFSIQLFVNQLYPAMQLDSLARGYTIELVPYGKANTTKSADGSYSFSCQHGDTECYGNKVHACALNKMKDSSKLWTYLTCLMEAVYPDRTIPYPADKCADLTKISDVDKQQIIACANSTEGSALLAEMGKITPSEIYKYGVPAVALNGLLDQVDDDGAQQDFLGTVCKHMASPRPSVCEQQTASSSVASLSVLVLLSTPILNLVL